MEPYKGLHSSAYLKRRNQGLKLILFKWGYMNWRLLICH